MMDFKKNLKTRLYLAISFIVLGIATIITSIITKSDNDYISSFGFALVVIGIARLGIYFRITKNENTIRKQEIAESDERNISIQRKAKSMAFMVFLLLSCVTVIVLSFLSLHEAAKWVCYPVCLLVLLYWIFYFVYQKIS